MARCIACRAEFNRSTAKDKLRCPKCTKADADAKPPGTLQAQLKKYQDKRAK